MNQMSQGNFDLLEKAIAAINDAAPPVDLYDRCLNQARLIPVPSLATVGWRKSFCIKPWSVAVVVAASLILFFIAIPSFFSAANAIGQVESSLAAVKSLRIEIVEPDSKESILISFSQGEGYRLESATRIEVDNGQSRLEVDKKLKRAVRFPSKLKTGYRVRQLLDEWTRLPEEDLRGDFERRQDLDQVINEEKLECFVWVEQLGLTQYESLAYRDRTQKIKLLSTRHRVGNDQPWQVDSLVRLSYDAIPKQEFDLNLGAEIELVEKNTKQVDVEGHLVDEDVLAIHEQLVNQWSAYYGLEFELQVKANRSYGPEVDKSSRLKCRAFPEGQVEFRDMFCVLAPKVEGHRPRRFWKRYHRENGQEILISAVSFDGVTTRSYTRGLGDSPGKGLVVGFEDVTPIDDIPNYYEQLLFLQLNLVNNVTPITPELSTFQLDRFHLAASHQREKWIENEFYYNGESGSGLYEIKVANHPVNRVVGYQIWLGLNGKREELGSLEVSDLEQFDGVWYPASGKFQQTGFRLLDEFVYRFNVVNVSRLPEDAEDSWWIDWPSRTIVNDQVNRRNEQR